MNNPNRLIHEKSPYLLQHAYNPQLVTGDRWEEKHSDVLELLFLVIVRKSYIKYNSSCHYDLNLIESE